MTEILQGKKFSAQGGPASGWKCAFCGGTGVQPRSLKSRCLACRGAGEVELESTVIQCPSCKGKGTSSNSSKLSCLRCKGIGVVETAKSEDDLGNIIRERLCEITKRLQWVQKETEKKGKEIEKKFEPIKPFVEEVKKEVKKEGLCLKELGNKVKKAWKSFWKD